jgi:hypothetical protein
VRLRGASGCLAAALCSVAVPAARADLKQSIDGARYPTAGIVADREYRLVIRAMPESCVLFGGLVGFKDVVHGGLFYGAFNIIDRGDPVFNDHVGFEVRVRLINETQWPALAAGFDSQGWGAYDAALDRYERKSPGYYLVASKNWRSFLGDLSLTAGGDYSLESDHDDRSLDFFASGDWFIAQRVSILLDFDAALNDNDEDGVYGEGGTYLDLGVRVLLGDYVSLMLVFSDLTGNLAPGNDSGREFQMVFRDRF